MFLTDINTMDVSKLKDSIKASGLSKKEIAQQSGISVQALYGILENNADPKVSNLEAIAKVLGIKMSVLFNESSIEVADNTRSVKRTINADINGRIREILTKVFANNATAMAKMSFVSSSTLNSIARGEFTPDYDTIRRIVEMPTPQINVDWLITGNGEMIENPRETTNNTENSIEVTDNTKSFNSNADEVIKDLTAIIKIQEERIAKLTDKLLDL